MQLTNEDLVDVCRRIIPMEESELISQGLNIDLRKYSQRNAKDIVKTITAAGSVTLILHAVSEIVQHTNDLLQHIEPQHMSPSEVMNSIGQRLHQAYIVNAGHKAAKMQAILNTLMSCLKVKLETRSV